MCRSHLEQIVCARRDVSRVKSCLRFNCPLKQTTLAALLKEREDRRMSLVQITKTANYSRCFAEERVLTHGCRWFKLQRQQTILAALLKCG